MDETLDDWLAALRARHGKMAEIAALIGMSESGFVRGMKAGTLSVQNVLTLAKATDKHPSVALRLARKGKIADLIEELYGVGAEALTTSQRELLDLWGRVQDDEETQRAIFRILRVAAGDAARAPRPSRHHTRHLKAVSKPRGQPERDEE